MWTVRPSGCHCTDAFGGNDYRRVPTPLRSTSPFSAARRRDGPFLHPFHFLLLLLLIIIIIIIVLIMIISYMSWFRCLVRSARCYTMSHLTADAVFVARVSRDTPDGPSARHLHHRRAARLSPSASDESVPNPCGYGRYYSIIINKAPNSIKQ